MTDELPSVNEALQEFFKLKQTFETQTYNIKRKILNNQSFSKREKRAEYLKLMPKCVNCRRPSRIGTRFSIVYKPSDDQTESFRTFKAECGDLANPCNLHIEIRQGVMDSIDTALNEIRSEIKQVKNTIIDDKNKLLFGLITTETALEQFDANKTYVSELTSLYEKYLDIRYRTIDSHESKIELDESLRLSYQSIDAIKDCIRNMNETNDTKYAEDAASIYHTTLYPLLQKIRQLKYSENIVTRDVYERCLLIQRKYTIDDTLQTTYTHQVVAYDVGFTALPIISQKQVTLTPTPAIQFSKTLSENTQITDATMNTKTTKPVSEVPMDEPAIGKGKDGIEWNIPEYTALWATVPQPLKNEFKMNIDWMKQFMYTCVNEKKRLGNQFEGCSLVTPPNLVIPPRQMENGQYDFGVSIYTKLFNEQPKDAQASYLTHYVEDPVTKAKDYGKLEEELNALVANELSKDSELYIFK
ncbi:MAG: hypothetical protein ACOVRN_13315 [Flavobacterium sp.]